MGTLTTRKQLWQPQSHERKRKTLYFEGKLSQRRSSGENLVKLLNMTTVRRNFTHTQQTAMLEGARRAEEQREDSLKQLAWEQMQAANLASEDRAEDKRLIRRFQMEQKEREMEEAIMKAERNRKIKEEQQAQEDALARELERVKLESERDDKMRQQIRECSTELRELEAQLRSAYMNKERKAQLAEKEATKYDKMARDAEIAKQMKEEHERATAAVKQKQLEEYEANVRYQQELERQLEEQEKKKQQEYEEHLKEKLMVDEIVRKIYEEDQTERERQKQKQDLTKRYIEEDQRMREEWRVQEKARLEAENAKIAQF